MSDEVFVGGYIVAAICLIVYALWRRHRQTHSKKRSDEPTNTTGT